MYKRAVAVAWVELLFVWYTMSMQNNGKASLVVSKQNLTSCEHLFDGDVDQKITTLDLSHNCLASFNVQEALHKFPALKNLNLSHNQIRVLHHSFMSRLPENFVLDVSNNPLEESCKHMSKLIQDARDKSVVIRLYDTKLPKKILNQMSSSIQKISLRMTIHNSMIYALAVMLAGFSLYVFSQADSSYVEASSSSSSVSNHAITSKSDTALVAAGSLSIIAALGLFVYPMIISMKYHELKKSMIYWHQNV